MENSIAILSLSALVAASVQTAFAGNCERATVGKVLTGVAAVQVLSHALHPAPVYVSAPHQVVYVPAPAPVVVYARPVRVQAPVIVAPRFCPPPFVNVSVGFGRQHRHHRHCR